MCRYVVHVWDVKKNHIRYIFNSSIFTAVLEVPRCTSLKVNYLNKNFLEIKQMNLRNFKTFIDFLKFKAVGMLMINFLRIYLEISWVAGGGG